MSSSPGIAYDSPIMSDEARNFVGNERDYVLHYGMQNDRASRKIQDGAYVNVRHKIVRREDSARAMIISANVLSMSVMSSQLSMYRWKVNEASNIAQATSILQEQVISATKKGYRVHRDRPKPLPYSKYADGAGLQKLMQKKMEKIQRNKQRRADRQAAARAAEREAQLKGIPYAPAAPMEDSDEDDFGIFKDDGSSSGGDDRDGGSRHSRSSSCCSAEDPNYDASKIGSSSTPADAITRLVIVDSYTHEPFEDILTHIRFLDEKYGLQLVVLLLLPTGKDLEAIQGSGKLLMPRFQTNIGDAYKCGFDLVLTHFFDHMVVDFLTNTFMSAAGRWRNDIRAKAAVGNYISLKNVLLGRIDIDALKALVWNDQVDDAELLEVIGNNTLALQGEAKRYTMAGQKLSRFASGISSHPGTSSGVGGGSSTASGLDGGGGADVLVLSEDSASMLNRSSHGDGNEITMSLLPNSMPQLRSREHTRNGVRSSGAKHGMLSSLTTQHDMLSAVMDPASQVQHAVRRLRRGANPDEEDEDAYEYVLVNHEEEQRAFMMESVEKELGRLIADNESKESTIQLLQTELERVTRTVNILKKHQDGLAASGEGGGHGKRVHAQAVERPDSGALVNLTKEQQIYILKERLEAANDQIMALMDSGAGKGGRRPNRGGISPSSKYRLHPGASRRGRGVDAGDDGGGMGATSAYQLYHEHREADMMRLFDFDAELVDAPAILHVPHGLVKGSPQRGSNNNSSRRDREQADKVISSLQEELLELQRRGFSGGDDGMSQRLVGKLQSALDQLSAQKQRISQLEELRKMDEVLRTNELKRLKDAKGGGGDGDEKGGGRKRRGKSGKAGAASSMTGMDESTTSTDVGAGRRGGGGKRSGGLATANASLSGPAENAALAKAKADYEEKLVAAAKKAEAQMQRERDDMHMHYQLELSRREKEMKPILNRLYLKIRRPYTKSYRTVLQKEANEAQGNARGAWQRLRFAVSQITDDQLRPPTQHRDRDGRSAAEDDEEEERGVVGRIADPDLRHQVEALAQEHAGFMLQADTAKREMEVIDAAFEADGRARYVELKEKRQALLEVAETTAKRSAKLEDYLGALKDVAEVEQEMGRWGDVDIGSHLTLTRTSSKLYRSRVDVDEEAEEPSGMSPVLATATTVASGNSSNTTNPAPMPLRVATTMSSEDDGALLHVVVTEASPTRSMDPHGSIITSVHTSDAGGMLRDIADAYRVAAGPLSRPPSESPLRRGGSKKSSPRGAGAGQSSHSRGLLSVEDGGWSEASASTSTIMLASALPDVQAVRQMSFSIASFEAMLKGLAESDAPEAEVQLYQHALQRFQDGLVHPDRMAEIGQQLRDRHLPPSLSIMAQVYATHRQELRRLLQLLSFTYPGLVPIAGFTEQGLDQQLLASLERIPQTSDEVRVPLVVANDTSLLTWAIEYIGTIVTQQREFMWVDGAIPPEAVDGFRRDQQLLEVLRANIPLRYLDEDDRRVQTYADVVAQQLGGDSTIAQQLNRFAAAGKAGASGGDDSPPSARSHNLTPYQSITSHISSHRKTSTGPRTPRRSGSNSTDAFPHMTEAGMVAEDLAAMFTKQHVGINPAELSAEEVYLREVVDSDDPNNDNVRIMRDIKQELAYINALKHQRMEELLLRYRIRQREIAYAEARAAAAAANAQNQKEARSMEIPDFEVKSGSPAWYGMEAAKRVKDILKRQKGPDQVVVGSSGVGIEVSRRSAFPRPPPREVRIIQTPRERLRAARHLPPIHRGLSQAQKQAGADENIDPYIDPRDGASLAAFSQIASYYDFDARDQLLFYTPDELEHRVMDFREYLNRASSRRGTTGDSANGAAQFNLRLGESPYLPIKVGTPQPASRGQNTTNNNNNNTTTTLPQGRPVPVTTSWTYGVPSQHVRAMLDQPSNQHDSVLFVPSQQTSEEGARYARNRVPRGNNRLLTASNPYASPAALAAQRLNAMLRMSMEDPTIGGGAAVSGAGVGAMMGQSWTPSRRPTRHMRGDDGHREAAAPANATTTSPSRAAARRHTSTSRVLMQTNLDGASTASPRNSPPMDIATNGRLTAEDSGAPGFPLSSTIPPTFPEEE